MTLRELGQAAYEGYAASSSGKSLISGQPLPSWDDQSQEIQFAWIDSAIAVAEKLGDYFP